jgi:hypothetical protein
MKKNISLYRTLLVTCLFSLGCIFVAFMIQNQANHSVTSCSYLDPISVDILATIFAFFLISEGLFDIFRCKHYPLKSQLTKSIRVGLGFAILTIHVMQFIHK